MIYLNASASRFMHCGRAFHLGVIEGWKPAQTPNNITFGIAFHEWAHLDALGDPLAMATARDTYGTIPCIITHSNLTKNYLTDVCCAAKLRSSPYRVINYGTKNAASELQFHCPINDDMVFCGTIDNLVTDASGNVYLRDYKTTSKTPSDFFTTFSRSNQFIAYQLALSLHAEAFTGSPLSQYKVLGTIIEGVFLSKNGVKFETSAPIIHDKATLDFYQAKLEAFKVPANTPDGLFNGTCRTCTFFDYCNGDKSGYIQEAYQPVED